MSHRHGRTQTRPRHVLSIGSQPLMRGSATTERGKGGGRRAHVVKDRLWAPRDQRPVRARFPRDWFVSLSVDHKIRRKTASESTRESVSSEDCDSTRESVSSEDCESTRESVSSEVCESTRESFCSQKTARAQVQARGMGTTAEALGSSAALAPASQRADEIQRVLREAREARERAGQTKWTSNTGHPGTSRQTVSGPRSGADSAATIWSDDPRQRFGTDSGGVAVSKAGPETLEASRVPLEQQLIEQDGGLSSADALGPRNSREAAVFRRDLRETAVSRPQAPFATSGHLPLLPPVPASVPWIAVASPAPSTNPTPPAPAAPEKHVLGAVGLDLPKLQHNVSVESERQRERERDAEDLQQVQGRVEEHRQRIMEHERDKDRTELARAREDGDDLERARQRETPGNEAEQRAVRERLLSQQMVLQQAARQAGGSPAASTAEASDTAAAAVQQKPIGYELHTRLSRGEGVLDVLETEEGACSVPSVSIRTRSLRHASVRGRLGVDLT